MKHILILCNGRPPDESLFHESRANADFFIAADGGANIARRWGSLPDVVIGDLDSFKPSGDESFEVILKADQESNDLEKALTYAQEQKGTHIQILGATGYRLDQTLKNLSVLKQFDPHFKSLSLIDNFGETRLIDSPFEMKYPIGTKISLFPLSGCVTGITTRGFKYPLTNESLQNGVRDGSSNEVIDKTVHITYKEGDLLLFVAQESSR